MSSSKISPKVIGLTGGIGSGKSTIAREFAALGVPVYHSDDRAKYLMNSDEELKQQLMALLGPETYREGLLNTGFVAKHIFADPAALKSWNKLVHPAVALDFAQWLSDQDSPYVLKEVAILFETGGETQCDAVVLVTALKGQRLARVMARDGTPKPQIDQRMDLQWSDDVKKEKADFVIENNDLALALKQVTNVHKALMEAR